MRVSSCVKLVSRAVRDQNQKSIYLWYVYGISHYDVVYVFEVLYTFHEVRWRVQPFAGF